ncbi:MAG: response regulator, partial [Candidatus Bipolaricaulota bacterium]
MKKILLIEDEGRIVRLIRDYLKKEGYRVIDARDGKEGLTAFERQDPDLIILDLMLPKKDGLEVAREIRKNSQIPIIMLTAKTEEVDRVTGLELGADDYVTKPFSLRELAARIKAVLRRTSGDLGKQKVVQRGELVIDT